MGEFRVNNWMNIIKMTALGFFVPLHGECPTSSTCSRLALTHHHHGVGGGGRGQGGILKVALEQKVLQREMGPKSIVTSHLLLITFSEPGLLLDAWGLRVAQRDWGGPRCF